MSALPDLPSALARRVRRLAEATARPANMSPSERWTSAVAGAGLVAFGLTRRRAIPGAALTMIGAGLFWRGFSGHSALYGLLGIDRAPDRAVLVEREDLRRFKRVLETGEVPSTEGQASAGRSKSPESAKL